MARLTPEERCYVLCDCPAEGDPEGEHVHDCCFADDSQPLAGADLDYPMQAREIQQRVEHIMGERLRSIAIAIQEGTEEFMADYEAAGSAWPRRISGEAAALMVEQRSVIMEALRAAADAV